MRIYLIVIAALILISVKNSFAAKFEVLTGIPNVSDGVGIEGTINPGDYDRFREFLITQGKRVRFHTVYLDSDGGDVLEALKFANLFDKAFVRTYVVPARSCNSACFIMWAGGVWREVRTSSLGVHRISLAKAEFDLGIVKKQISPLSKSVSDYLLYLGIPRALVDKMNETPASSMFMLDEVDIKYNGWYESMAFQPTFLDAIEKVCGRNPYPKEVIGNFKNSDLSKDQQLYAKYQDWIKCGVVKMRHKAHSNFIDDELTSIERGGSSIIWNKKDAALVERYYFPK